MPALSRLPFRKRLSGIKIDMTIPGGCAFGGDD
jgi:hypothetical protein